MKKIILIVLAVVFVILAVVTLRPIPIVSEDEALVVTGKVSDIYETGIKDITIRLEENDCIYYINRGLERGIEMGEFKQKLIGKEVELKYPKYWTPLDWNNKVKHISKVELNGEVIFNELKSN